MKSLHLKILPVFAGAILLLVGPARTLAAQKYAVWLDGYSSSGGNPIPSELTSLGFSVTLVTTTQLETPNFLSSNGFAAIAVSRYDANYGTFLSATAAANVAAWVGAPGPTQGGVAVFTNDLADNLPTGADPYDANLTHLFDNAAQYAAASGHGFLGEFNGAVMAMASNNAGAPAMGLLQGNASATESYNNNQFHYDVGPIGSGNPIDAGVTFPFTDVDTSTFLTRVTGANSGNVVDIYTDSLGDGSSINNLPAVLANSYVISGGNPNGSSVPDTGTTAVLLGLAIVGLLAFRRRLICA